MSKLETFGVIPLPEQIKEFDKELTVRTFTELMHQINCGCMNCKGGMDKTARLLLFGQNTRRKEAIIKKLAKTEAVIFQFKKGMDRDLKYI